MKDMDENDENYTVVETDFTDRDMEDFLTFLYYAIETEPPTIRRQLQLAAHNIACLFDDEEIVKRCINYAKIRAAN